MIAETFKEMSRQTSREVGDLSNDRFEGDAQAPRAMILGPQQAVTEQLASTPWDAIIIGAGPGGSVAACVLAQRGRRVLLVERSHMPREKVCGCCLADAGAEALRTIGLSAVLDGAASVRVCTLRAGRSSVRVHISPYRVLDRATLDYRLALCAKNAGAKVLTGWNARVRTDGDVDLRLATPSPLPQSSSRPSSHPTQVRAQVVIVADGLGGSSLSEHAAFTWSISPSSRMGAWATLERSPLPLSNGEMTMLSHRSGYLGLVRLPSGAFDLAAALDPAEVRDAGGPAALCARIITACSGDAQAILGARWRGTPLLTRRRSRVESGTVMVLGDAAGYVEPFTGEGMTWAIKGAITAAAIADERIAGTAHAGVWAAAHANTMRRQTHRCILVTRLVRHERVLRLAIAGARFWPLLGEAAVRLLAPPIASASRVQA